MGSGKGGSGNVRVSEYHMSLHIGICLSSPDMELLEVKIGDKIAWRGGLKQNDVRKIDRPGLFGGKLKEGGVSGLLWWLNGNDDQRLPGPLARRMGYTLQQCPGFRGLTSIMLTGFRTESIEGLVDQWPGYKTAIEDTNNGAPSGFMLGANNPYLKKISVRVRSAPQGLDPSIAMIRLPDSSIGRAQYAANPAHIIFECMTDPSLGMGESYGAIDIASFTDAAQKLYDEKFGLNLTWTSSAKIEDFVREVLDHIQGALFVDAGTGKHTLKLMRADYVIDALPQITPDNARLTAFKRRVWAEISNEVVVTWTNPETQKEETVVAQDLAAIASQGGVSSAARNYHGVAEQALAMRLAERDLASLVHPIITTDAEVTREFWQANPFGVYELVWPEKGVASTILRVSKVSKGSTSGTVKLQLYEDVFSLGEANYLTEVESGWVDTSLEPSPLDTFYLGTAPAFMMASALGMADPSEIRSRQTMSLLLVAPDTNDDIGYELMTFVANVSGTIVRRSLGDKQLNGTFILFEPLGFQTRTVIPIPSIMGLPAAVGDFVMVGTSDTESEIMVIREIGETTVTLDRGMLDTVPRYWPTGTRVFIISATSLVPDTIRRSTGEQARYRFLTQTSQGQLAFDAAPDVSTVLNRRPEAPLRVANLRVGGMGFAGYTLPAGENLTVTWFNRNRVEESTQAFLWTDPGVALEENCVNSVIITNTDTGVETVGLVVEGNAESAIVPRAKFAGIKNARVSVRTFNTVKGIRCLQEHSVPVVVA